MDTKVPAGLPDLDAYPFGEFDDDFESPFSDTVGKSSDPGCEDKRIESSFDDIFGNLLNSDLGDTGFGVDDGDDDPFELGIPRAFTPKIGSNKGSLHQAFTTAIGLARQPATGIGELVARALTDRVPIDRVMLELIVGASTPGLELTTTGCEPLAKEFARLGMVPTSASVRCPTSKTNAMLFGLGITPSGTLAFVSATDVCGYAIPEKTIPVRDVSDFFEKLVEAIARLQVENSPIDQSMPDLLSKRVGYLDWVRKLPTRIGR